MKGNDVIWSADEKKRGSISSRMIHTDIKSLKEAHYNDAEHERIARVRIFAWMRRADEVLSNDNVNELLPEGFNDFDSCSEFGLPTKLLQKGK